MGINPEREPMKPHEAAGMTERDWKTYIKLTREHVKTKMGSLEERIAVKKLAEFIENCSK